MQRDIVMDIGSGLTLTLHPEEARELHERLAEWCQTTCPCYQRGQNEEES